MNNARIIRLGIACWVPVFVGGTWPANGRAAEEAAGTQQAKSARRHAQAVKKIERLGGKVSSGKDRNGKPSVAVRIGKGWKGRTEGLIHLANLNNLKSLDLNIPLDEEALENVEPLTDLESLRLRKAEKLTDDALVLLQPLTNLRRLTLFNAQVTVDGMKHLAGLKQLTYMRLRPRKKVYTGRAKTNLRKLLPLVSDW